MKRIAVIEDNPDNRLLLSALLEERFEVLEFASGAEALEQMPAQRPDLVLLDISLPGMDGIAVLRLLRADAELGHLPVVAVTAHAMAGDRERFLAEGFDDYLSKPIVDERQLIEMLECWIARRPA